MTDTRHLEQRERSPETSTLPFTEIPHVARDGGHLKINPQYI